MWDSARVWDQDFLVPFTSHANLLGAVLMLWSAAALVRPLPTPPAWLQGAAVLYLSITAVVYSKLIGYPAERPPTSLFGLTNTEILHGLVPAAVAVAWLVWGEHRRLEWRWALWWLSYLYVYLGIMLVRAQISPEAGYPYFFIDLQDLGASAFMRNVAIFTILFALCGAAIVWVDRVLPSRMAAALKAVPALRLTERAHESVRNRQLAAASSG